MTRILEIRRHTDDADGDVLSPDGVEAAVELGREGALGGYTVVATSGAQRATQTAACVLAGLGEEVPGGVHVVHEFRSEREDEWRAAYQAAGSGHLDDLREAAPELAADDGAVLADALRDVLDLLEEGQRALVIGHSPTSEAAVHGLTGATIEPLGKGEGVLVEVTDDGDHEVARLDAT